jgi:hypothetical protein
LSPDNRFDSPPFAGTASTVASCAPKCRPKAMVCTQWRALRLRAGSPSPGWFSRIRPGVDNVDARGAQACHHEITPLHVRMGRGWAKAGATGIPSEMVQLVAGCRHVHPTHKTARNPSMPDRDR